MATANDSERREPIKAFDPATVSVEVIMPHPSDQFGTTAGDVSRLTHPHELDAPYGDLGKLEDSA